MNEGQIYRAEEIKKAVEDIEKIVMESGVCSPVFEIIMSNAEIIKHHSVSLLCRVDEGWDRTE